MMRLFLVLLVGSVFLSQAADRVFNGNDASPGEYPYYVAPQSGNGFCGASLIAHSIVLTAAHCQYDFSGSLSSAPVFAGSVKVSAYRGSDYSGGAISRRILGSVSIHPSYNPRNNAFDFALFRIEDVPNAVPVPLNRDALNPFDGEVLTAIGMGALDDITGRYPEVLQEVQVQAVSQAECSRVYGGWISSDMVCAGGHGQNVDVCGGDSGGPLIDETGTQVGLVSFGGECLEGNRLPGVYARVSEAIDWIEVEACALDPTVSWCQTASDFPSTVPVSQAPTPAVGALSSAVPTAAGIAPPTMSPVAAPTCKGKKKKCKKGNECCSGKCKKEKAKKKKKGKKKKKSKKKKCE